MNTGGERTTWGRARPILAVMVASVLAACAVGPDYRAPQTSTPDTFVAVDNVAVVDGEIEREFWKRFNDPRLNELIEAALTSNHDVRIAAGRWREARALRSEVQFDLAPTVTQQGSYVDAHVSERQTAGLAGADRDQAYYESSFDASWELDVFGRVRRGLEAATAELQSAQAAFYGAQVSITAEVARTYFELRGAQARLEVAQRNAANQRESLQLTSTRREAGRGTQLDVARAQAQLSATLATIPGLEAQVSNSIARLSTLIGREPQALAAQLSSVHSLPELPRAHSIGTPESMLRRRPDVVAAEREVAAATARIGVAVGDLFPKITFVGSWGFDALSGSEVSDSGTGTYAFGPSIRWAAFDLGRVRQRIQQREAAADVALARYEQTVLRALEEMDAGLTNYSKSVARQTHLEEGAQASLQAAQLARVRFENGAEDFLAVLDAERNALQAEDARAAGEVETATALLAIYKALGGGFRPMTAEMVARK